MNDQPCETCNHFDPILRGNPAGGHKETNSAWCSKRSVYPFKEGPGQVFPDGVARVESGATLAKPFIVKKGQIESTCKMYQLKRARPSKAQLLEMAQKK